MATVKKRGKSYYITVSNGYDIAGKQIRKTATYTPDASLTPKQQEKALQAFVFDFEQKIKNGAALDGHKITLQQFYYKWLNEYAKISLEPTTTEWYTRLFNNNILPALGHMKLSDIKPLNIQAFYNSLTKEGAKADGTAYSPTSIKRFHSALSSLLNKAVEWELIPSNPAKKTSLPKQKAVSDSVKYFTPEQAIIFLNALNGEYETEYQAHTRISPLGDISTVQPYKQTKTIPTQFKVLFNIALYGGLRRGELLALTWDDVDFEQNTITINKSAAVVNNKVIIKAPKNKSSERVITLPKSVMQLTNSWRLEQMELRLSLGEKWQGDNYIFIQWNGKLMNPSTPYHTFKDIIEKYNNTVTDEALKLPNIRFHDLRHTSATLLIAAHTDVKTVSARLGHAQTSTTMNIYAHSFKKLDEVASDTLEDILGQNKA